MQSEGMGADGPEHVGQLASSTAWLPSCEEAEEEEDSPLEGCEAPLSDGFRSVPCICIHWFSGLIGLFETPR